MQQRGLGVRVEPLAELLERLAGGGRGDLGVDLHRDGDLAVPQDLHREARVHVERGQQRAACLAGPVHGDRGNLGGGDTPGEAAVEVPRLNRSAVTSREHQAGFDPGLTGAGAVSVLLLLADLERSDAQARQGEGRFRCLGLDLAAEELAADPLELLTDVQLCGVQVDELPGESEYLAFAQA